MFQLKQSLANILKAYIRLWDTSVSAQDVIGSYSESLYTFMGQYFFSSSRLLRIFCRPIYVHGALGFQFLEPSLTFFL